MQHCVLSSGRSTKPLEAHEEQLIDWVLNRNATIMVCGEAKSLAPSVRHAWENLLELSLTGGEGATLSGSENPAGEAYIRRMRSERRYLEDVWI